ncbi:MAG: hypothetical protein C0443_08465 [Comamonadaceae bacterium]|nr:hypothetical protein [Comamonadaceae bacterium]
MATKSALGPTSSLRWHNAGTPTEVGKAPPGNSSGFSACHRNALMLWSILGFLRRGTRAHHPPPHPIPTGLRQPRKIRSARSCAVTCGCRCGAAVHRPDPSQ